MLMPRAGILAWETSGREDSRRSPKGATESCAVCRVFSICWMRTAFAGPSSFRVIRRKSHPDAIREIARSGHEIGHHGYLHERPDTLSPEQERAVLEKGLEAIERVVGVRTVGYRSPSWEITPTTLELLRTFGFLYDSSGMGDDQPYVERSGGIIACWNCRCSGSWMTGRISAMKTATW